MNSDPDTKDNDGLDSLRWVRFFSNFVAADRGSDTISVADLIAGIYIADIERVAAYWPDWDSLEEFVTRSADINDPRWFYWLRFMETLQKSESEAVGRSMRPSKEVEEVYEHARKLRGKRANSRDILWALASSPQFQVVEALRKSGLDLHRLERDISASPK